MAFLGNDAINRVNLHSGIQALATGVGGVFFLVVLLRAGVPVPAALLTMAAIVGVRFLLRPAILPLAKRTGLKPLLVFGAVAMAATYPVLAEVRGVGPTLVLLCTVTSLADIFYWVSYNAYFAALGDAEHRGHQIGAREALVGLTNIVAPLCGAWALLALGNRWTFALVALVQALSAVPLIGLPNVPVKQRAPGALRAARMGFLLAASDAWFDSCFLFVWQIALFFSLGESVAAYGGAMALAGLAGAAAGLLLGRHVDLGHGRRSVAIACAAVATVILLRAMSLDLPWLAVAANALGFLAMPLLIPVLGTASYNLAKASPCPLRFYLAAEAGWDIGCFVACVVTAGMAAAGAPLAAGILLALLGIGSLAALLWRYYGGVGALAPV
jgi:MFS family permease